jgi:hypothetical protein
MAQKLELCFDYDAGENCYIAQIGDIYRVRAENDDSPESPREWDNVATMVCHHGRYNLGDYKSGESDAIAAIRSSRDYRDTWEESESYQFTFKGVTRDCFDFSNPSDVWQAMQLCSDIVSQPLYLYDHSGITISTGSFSCPWDSGQVGFAFVTYDTIRKEQSCKAVTEKHKAWAARMIDCETETYDTYLTGQVYGYISQVATAWDSDGEASEWEDLDSCWGYYGDFDKSGLAESALDSITGHMKTRPQELAIFRASMLDTMRELIASRSLVMGQARDAIQSRIAAIAADSRAANMQSRLITGVAS